MPDADGHILLATLRSVHKDAWCCSETLHAERSEIAALLSPAEADDLLEKTDAFLKALAKACAGLGWKFVKRPEMIANGETLLATYMDD